MKPPLGECWLARRLPLAILAATREYARVGVELEFVVQGLPPAKSEAKSMMAAGHPHAARVVALLESARAAAELTDTPSGFGARLVGLELAMRTVAAHPPSDATNYLGGVGDVLERKTHRTGVEHLGDLWDVQLFDNDRQVRDVRFRHERAQADGYTVRIWPL